MKTILIAVSIILSGVFTIAQNYPSGSENTFDIVEYELKDDYDSAIKLRKDSLIAYYKGYKNQLIYKNFDTENWIRMAPIEYSDRIRYDSEMIWNGIEPVYIMKKKNVISGCICASIAPPSFTYVPIYKKPTILPIFKEDVEDVVLVTPKYKPKKQISVDVVSEVIAHKDSLFAIDVIDVNSVTCSNSVHIRQIRLIQILPLLHCRILTEKVRNG